MTDQQIQEVIEDNGGNFRPEEFLDGRENLRKNIVEGTVKFRNWHGFMMQITSAYRPSGSHRYGRSVDALLWSQWQEHQPPPMKIWRVLTTWTWLGVGMYFDWEQGVGVHFDLVPPSLRQRPLRWIRVEGVYYYESLHDGLFRTNNMTITTSLKTEINKWDKTQT